MEVGGQEGKGEMPGQECRRSECKRDHRRQPDAVKGGPKPAAEETFLCDDFFDGAAARGYVGLAQNLDWFCDGTREAPVGIQLDDHCELTRFLRLAHGVLIDFATWRRPVSSRIGLTKGNASSGCAA